jgi:predicted MFS family arabinose efflux permease
MHAELGWSYTQAGGMNTANGVGYLAGSLLAPIAMTTLGERRVFIGAFALTATAIFASGLTDGYLALLLLRGLAGVAGAVLFVSGATFAARLASASPSPGLVLGVYFAGVGPGILISALLIPSVFATPQAWRAGWIGMGALAGISAVVAGRTVLALPTGPSSWSFDLRGLRRLHWAIMAFSLFGFGYISYMTFIVAYFHELGGSGTQVMLFWALLAFATLPSGWVWSRLLDRAGGGTALAVLLVVATIGAALPLVSHAVPSMAASAVLFGGSFLAVIAAMAQLVRRTLPPHGWAVGLAATTTLFAVGQAVGPILTGYLADRSGGLLPGLALSAGLLGAAAVVATRQRPPRPPQLAKSSATSSPKPPPGTSDIDLNDLSLASTCQERISSHDQSPDSLVSAK